VNATRSWQPLALLVLGAAAIAALWPLTAMEVSPALFPLLLIGGAVLLVSVSRPALGVAIALAATPLIDAVIPLGDTTGRIAQPLQVLLPGLIACVAFIVAVSRSRRATPVPLVLALAPLLFLGLTLASSMQAIEPAQSINSIVILCAAVLTFYVALQLSGDPGDRMTILSGVLVGLLIAGLQGTVQQVLGLGGPYGVSVGGGREVLRVQGSFDHPNFYSVYLIALIPLAAAIALSRGVPTRLRRLAGVAVALALTGLVFSYSRGAIIGLVVGALAWVFLLRPGRVTLLATVLAVLTVVAAPASLKARFDPGTARDDAGLREALWQAAYDMGKREPLLGVGPNNFSVAYERLVNRRGDAEERPLLDQGEGFVLPSSGHNVYLNTLAEQGVLGLLGLLVLAAAVVPLLYAGRRASDPLGRAICGGVGAGAAAWAVRGMFDAGLYGDVIVPAAALVAICVVIVTRDGLVTIRTPSR
jgi:O-antigen ligase